MSVGFMRPIAFALSLIGGLVITAGSAIAVFLSAMGRPTGYRMGLWIMVFVSKEPRTNSKKARGAIRALNWLIAAIVLFSFRICPMGLIKI